MLGPPLDGGGERARGSPVQRPIPGQGGRGLRPALGVPLAYGQSVGQLPPLPPAPIWVSESVPAKLGWKFDVSGLSRLYCSGSCDDGSDSPGLPRPTWCLSLTFLLRTQDAPQSLWDWIALLCVHSDHAPPPGPSSSCQLLPSLRLFAQASKTQLTVLLELLDCLSVHLLWLPVFLPPVMVIPVPFPISCPCVLQATNKTHRATKM